MFKLEEVIAEVISDIRLNIGDLILLFKYQMKKADDQRKVVCTQDLQGFVASVNGGGFFKVHVKAGEVKVRLKRSGPLNKL